jgi:hypothetical protein
MLVQKSQYLELDRVFFRVVTAASVALVIGGSAFLLLLYVLQVGGYAVATRLLPIPSTTLLLGAMLISLITGSQAFYVRAHKREPFVVVGVLESICVGIAVWWFGKNYGPWGAALGILVVRVLLSLPAYSYLWWRCHRDERSAQTASFS